MSLTLIRRAILSLALIAGLSPAFAQVPPPVPALPDTERRTSYSISGTTCACAVNFALYGDSTDVGNWIEVFINGAPITQSGNWTISSPTGPLATIPRPITDAVLTFTNVQTGTVQIVGARRPRRTAQFAENRGVAARDLNQAITDIIAMLREDWDKINDVTGRGVFAPPGETLALLPVLASRINQGACFNSSGFLTSCVSVPASTFAAGNGILFTGVNPTTISNNISAGNGITITGTNPLAISSLANTRSAYSGTNSLQTSDCFKTAALGGSAFYTFTINAASGYPAACQAFIVNEDNICPTNGASTCRGKVIAINGYASFILWPGQSFWLVNQNNVWQYNQPGRWAPLVGMTWHINHASGNNSNDGLATGAAAFATIQGCINVVESLIDFGQADIGPTCKNDPETFTENNSSHTHPLTGYHVISITGDTVTPSNVVWQVSGTGNIATNCRDGGNSIVTGFRFVSTGTANFFINGGQLGVCDFGSIDFGPNPNGYDLYQSSGGSMNWFGGSLTITGDMAGWVLGTGEGHVLVDGATVSLPNARTFTNFIQLGPLTNMSATAMTFTGAGSGLGSTGSKFSVTKNAALGLGATSIPGASAGTTATGGLTY